MSAAEGLGRPLTLGEIADLVEGRVVGDPDVVIDGVAPMEEAGPQKLGFLAARKYVRHLATSHAAAVLVSDELAEVCLPDVPNRVVAADAHQALAALLAHLYPTAPRLAGIHPTAVLGVGVQLGVDVSIGPYAVLADGVALGDRVAVGPHCCIGAGTRIGDDTLLHAQVVLYAGTEIGQRVIVHSGACLGVDGFGYVFEDGTHRKVPQVGRCVVEDDVEIGANTCLDRGSIGQTVIERGAKLDNLIHVGHNVRVGALSLLAAMVGIAGSAKIGKGVTAGGQVGIGGHLEIGDGAQLGGQAGVVGDVAPGEAVSGYPARRHRDYLRAMGQVFKLPELVKRVRRLEDANRHETAKEKD